MIFNLLLVARAADDPECPLWASKGECVSNPGYMLAHCADACGAVAGGAVSADAPRDLEPECAGYAQAGECARNPAFMLSRCKLSCDAWERAHGVTLDTDGQCVDDSLVGRCVEEPGAMAIRCNASCEIAQRCRAQRIVSLGVCDKALRCEVLDLDQDCAARAACGECASQPVTMAQRCLPTCSRADMDSVMRTHLPEAAVIVSPLIDVPRAASAAASRCGLSPYATRINNYKLHYPDRCYIHSAAPRRSRSARDTARARAAALQLYRARPRTAAQRAGYVHASTDAPAPCPYDAATTTPRVSVAPRALRMPVGGVWHTEHTVTIVHVLASPRVRLLHDFLVGSEASELIAMAQPHFRPSPVRSVASSKRTSSTAMLPAESDVVRRVRARVAHFSGYPLASLEPMQIVRYEPLQRYEPHHDLFDLCDFEQRPRRHVTFLIYLSVRRAGARTPAPVPRRSPDRGRRHAPSLHLSRAGPARGRGRRHDLPAPAAERGAAQEQRARLQQRAR
jgi:prolyl 4-hydroxylase